MSVNQIIKDILTCPLQNPRGAYISPTYAQSKRIAWDMFKEFAGVIPGVNFNESELRIDFPNNGRIYLYGSDNYDSLRGIYLDSVIFDEYALQNPKVWTEVVRPALADRKGKAVWIGTPLGMNRFYEIYEEAEGQEDWYRVLLTVKDTEALDPKELEAAQREMSRDAYEQEFLCSWSASVKGAYYASELQEARLQGRITGVPWEPSRDVHTCWDLGISDATAIFFVQEVAGEFRVIDHYEFTDTSLIDIIKELRELPYTYGTHWGPHDLAQRELSSGRSRQELAADLGFHFDIVPKLPVADGIELGRILIRKSWFDKDHCKYALECLSNYKKKWDDKLQVYRDKPLHDWSSHTADSWRYLGVAYEQLIRPVRVGPPRQKRAIG